MILFQKRKYKKMANNFDTLRAEMLYKKIETIIIKIKHKNFNKITKYSKYKKHL